MDIAKFVGDNIKAVRSENGLTQREVCNIANLSESQLSSFENGKQLPGLTSLANLAKALNTSIDRLYFGTPSEAFLNQTEDFGFLVVNCFLKLKELGVIEVNTNYNDLSLDLLNFSSELARLINSLSDLESKKEYYSRYQVSVDELQRSVVNEINAKHDEMTKNETNPYYYVQSKDDYELLF